jgi:hypothetical protein
VLPLIFSRSEDYNRLDVGDMLSCEDLRDQIASGSDIVFKTSKGDIQTAHHLDAEEIAVILDGGVIAHRRCLSQRKPDERCLA